MKKLLIACTVLVSSCTLSACYKEKVKQYKCTCTWQSGSSRASFSALITATRTYAEYTCKHQYGATYENCTLE